LIHSVNFSVIIPSYNSEQYLSGSLELITKYLDLTQNEVIVVDDASTDQSLSIAKKFPVRVIERDLNGGPAAARNTGVRVAKGKVYVFIDADVLIGSDTFNLISKQFLEDPSIDAITGLFSLDISREDNFPTAYKNRYMNFVFKQCNKNVNFLFGSIAAIKNESFISWPEHLRYGEDAFLGQLISGCGGSIRLNHDLQIRHLKKYSYLSLFKNDFLVSRNFAEIFLKFNQWRTLLPKSDQFSHVGKFQLYSLAICGLSFLSVLFYPSMAVLLVALICWLFVNRYFLSFFFKHSGFLSGMFAAILTIFDHFVMGFGVVFGILSYVFLRKRSFSKQPIKVRG